MKPKIYLEGVFAITGLASYCGREEMYATKIAVDQLKNKANLAFGIELSIKNTESKNEITAGIIKDLSHKKVDVIIGPTWADSYNFFLDYVWELPKTLIVSPSSVIEFLKDSQSFTNLYSNYYRNSYIWKSLIVYFSQKYDDVILILNSSDKYWEYVENSLLESEQFVKKGLISEIIDSNKLDKIDVSKFESYSKNKKLAVFFGVSSKDQFQKILDLKIKMKNRGLEVDFYSQESVELFTSGEGLIQGLDGLKYLSPKKIFSQSQILGFYKEFKKQTGNFPSSFALKAWEATYLSVEMFSQNFLETSGLSESSYSSPLHGQVSFDSFGGLPCTDTLLLSFDKHQLKKEKVFKPDFV